MIVAGVRNPNSIGIERYARHLAGALHVAGVDYRCTTRPRGHSAVHFHLANSSRGALLQAPQRRDPYVVTVHDVQPRTKPLAPLYAGFIYPVVVGRAARVIVHSTFAADLLRKHLDVPRGRLEVIHHAAPAPAVSDRTLARAILGWEEDTPIAVLPGAARTVKLVHEAIDAAARTAWRLVLVGQPRDAGIVRHARAAGVPILCAPADETYEAAITGSDLVLVLRRDSVGETNGPLLDALGAGRAVLATRTGSVPELARGAAALCDPTVDSIASALRSLESAADRRPLETAATARAAEMSWERAAEAHRAVFEGTFA